MEAKNAILNRRSVRKFENTSVPREYIEALIEAADSAPSACNRRPLNFYAITSESVLSRLSGSGKHTNMYAPLAIVVAGDLDRALPRSFRDYWIHDGAAATENILIRATDLGLGSCWCGAHLQESVLSTIREILSLPENIVPFSLIWIGYPAECKEPHKGYNPDRVFFID